MKNLINRAKYVCGGEEGMGTIEIVIMIAVALVIGTGLYIFGDNIVSFFTKSGASVDGLDTKIDRKQE